MKRLLILLPAITVLSIAMLLVSDTSVLACGAKEVDTAIGCIPTTPGGIGNAIFKLAIRIAGAIAIILVIIGGFRVGLSHGDPEALQAGRDMITSAIIGLVFILLATVILGILGVDVIGISFIGKDSSGDVNFLFR